MLTLGKPLGSGIPCAAYGFSKQVGARLIDLGAEAYRDISGIGGTLAGNALSMAAARHTLKNVITEEAYAHMLSLGVKFERGVQRVINEFNLPWHVTRLGCRVEYWFCDPPPRNGGQAAAAFDEELTAYMHLAALNRGILITPFHNMALMSPATTEADVDLHTQVFRESVSALMAIQH
jgi:glutamate-1-semialdehyde 2,1-aminomutase